MSINASASSSSISHLYRDALVTIFRFLRFCELPLALCVCKAWLDGVQHLPAERTLCNYPWRKLIAGANSSSTPLRRLVTTYVQNASDSDWTTPDQVTILSLLLPSLRHYTDEVREAGVNCAFPTRLISMDLSLRCTNAGISIDPALIFDDLSRCCASTLKTLELKLSIHGLKEVIDFRPIGLLTQLESFTFGARFGTLSFPWSLIQPLRALPALTNMELFQSTISAEHLEMLLETPTNEKQEPNNPQQQPNYVVLEQAKPRALHSLGFTDADNSLGPVIVRNLAVSLTDLGFWYTESVDLGFLASLPLLRMLTIGPVKATY